MCGDFVWGRKHEEVYRGVAEHSLYVASRARGRGGGYSLVAEMTNS
jgi:L-amino acid N-acyltransferase YncA